MKNHTYIMICLLFCMINLIFAQDKRIDPESSDAFTIKNYISQRYNVEDYYVSGCRLGIELNNIDQELVDDNNEILFFIASKRLKDDDEFDYMKPVDSTIVGFYTNGEIFWHSEPELVGEFNDVTFIQDINNDNKIDIGFTLNESLFNSSAKYLWIISFNGKNSEIINESSTEYGSQIVQEFYDPTHGKYSRIVSYLGFSLFDWDNDGILEIKCIWADENDDSEIFNAFPKNNPSITKPHITYGWNGSKYGFYSNIYQLGETDYFPANRLKAYVKCNVREINFNINYNYEFENNKNSMQAIDYIYLDNLDPDNLVFKVPNKWMQRDENLINGWLWTTTVDGPSIAPGQTQNGFEINSTETLPKILKLFIQGKRPVTSSQEITDDIEMKDILNNSVLLYSIAPIEFPSDMSTSEIIDTLSNYTYQSYNLGWIEDEKTFNKVMDKLEEAKSQLANGNTRETVKLLNDLLKEVEKENGKKLTSEAYALLKYNTRYLLEELGNKKDAAD